jgi:hypothetical protein
VAVLRVDSSVSLELVEKLKPAGRRPMNIKHLTWITDPHLAGFSMSARLIVGNDFG